ncbi:Plant UBX domain-containing protein 7 [Sesamum angolense]|uniref:Plant UBX domain-containing protein 7 n=1 Tax=Sesamum angolense TaxID=2727404 RepID=A0AAE2BW95_9LAMI|nr:Plant UBX domain-containing protein 7 [Sesamum angolense]
MSMEGVLSPTDQQKLVSSFLEIAVGETADTARQFLQDAPVFGRYEVVAIGAGGFLVLCRMVTSGLWWRVVGGMVVVGLVWLRKRCWWNTGSCRMGLDGAIGSVSGFRVVPWWHWRLASTPTHGVRTSMVIGLGRVVPLGSELGKELVDKDVRQDGDDVRPPLPVKRDVLYDNPMVYGGARVGGSSYASHTVVPFRNFEEEMKHPGVWESEGGSSSSVADKTQDNLASLYRPPFALMFHGPFEKAKDEARMQNKWLLVNMQSTKEFSSHMLNRDTWANEAVAQTIKTNFVFWQVYDHTEEGSKVCTYYRLDSIPVILVIDPITGQKMHSWRGMVQPENLLEDLLPFMDGNPSDHHVSLSHKRPRESSQAPIPHVQSMPEENNEDEELQRALAASMENFKEIDGVDLKEVVGVRLPDGRRVQRNFLRTDPVQLLWSFCYSELKEDRERPFRLTQAIPGASRSLDFDVHSTFEESGLANTMVSAEGCKELNCLCNWSILYIFHVTCLDNSQ